MIIIVYLYCTMFSLALTSTYVYIDELCYIVIYAKYLCSIFIINKVSISCNFEPS